MCISPTAAATGASLFYGMVSAEEYAGVHVMGTSFLFAAAALMSIIFVIGAYVNFRSRPACGEDEQTTVEDYSETVEGLTTENRAAVKWAIVSFFFLLFFLPTSIVNYAILDFEYFAITQDHAVNGTTANNTDVFNHVALCAAIQSEYDCFQDSLLPPIAGKNNAILSRHIKKKRVREQHCLTPGTGGSCQVFEYNAVVTCNPGNVAVLSKMEGAENFTISDFEYGVGVKCYKYKKQGILPYLDSFGIAAGIVAIFTYTLDNFNSLLIGVSRMRNPWRSRIDIIRSQEGFRLILCLLCFVGSLVILFVVNYHIIPTGAKRHEYNWDFAWNNIGMPSLCIAYWLMAIGVMANPFSFGVVADQSLIRDISHIESVAIAEDKGFVKDELIKTASQLAEMQKMIDALTEKLNAKGIGNSAAATSTTDVDVTAVSGEASNSTPVVPETAVEAFGGFNG